MDEKPLEEQLFEKKDYTSRH